MDCPRCGGRMLPNLIESGGFACMGCAYATYDDDVAGQQDAWDAYAAEAGEDQAEHFLGPRPGPGRRTS